MEAGGREVSGGGAAGEDAEFEGADGFVGVVGMDAGGGFGVEAAEEAADGAWAALFAELEAGTEGFVAGGTGRETIEEGAEVEACAAAEDGKAAAAGEVGEKGADFGGEVAGGEEVGGGAEIDEVVGNGAAIGEGEFGGADVEAGVELDGVEVDDFAVETFGEGESEGGLPSPGGPGDGDEGKVGHYFQIPV